MMNVPITLREWDWDKLFETTLKTQDEMEMEMRDVRRKLVKDLRFVDEYCVGGEEARQFLGRCGRCHGNVYGHDGNVNYLCMNCKQCMHEVCMYLTMKECGLLGHAVRNGMPVDERDAWFECRMCKTKNSLLNMKKFIFHILSPRVLAYSIMNSEE